MSPAISVVLPIRNGSRYLEEAVTSLLSQTFTDFELLAVDDGSTDRSPQQIRHFESVDRRVRLLRSREPGLPSALNTGIAQATGRYVARMDSDDVSLPTRFERQVTALDSKPDLLVVGSSVRNIDRSGRTVGTSWLPSSPQAIRAVLAGGHCCLCHPATMIRRSALVAVGGYRRTVPLTEDFDLWLRLSRMGDLQNLPWPLLEYRIHEGSVAFSRTTEQVTSLLRSVLLDQAHDLEMDRSEIETNRNVVELLRRFRPNEKPAASLLNLFSWYVENAATAGDHRSARRLARHLSRLGPLEDARWAESELLQVGAMAAAARGQRLSALRYVALAGAGRMASTTMVRAIFYRPNILQSPTNPTQRSGDEGGHVDWISTYEGGRTLLVRGWLPLEAGALPRGLWITIGERTTTESFRLVPRPDVARLLGGQHLCCGFTMTLSLDQPTPGLVRSLEIWAQRQDGRWRRLSQAGTTLDLPE